MRMMSTATLMAALLGASVATAQPPVAIPLGQTYTGTVAGTWWQIVGGSPGNSLLMCIILPLSRTNPVDPPMTFAVQGNATELTSHIIRVPRSGFKGERFVGVVSLDGGPRIALQGIQITEQSAEFTIPPSKVDRFNELMQTAQRISLIRDGQTYELDLTRYAEAARERQSCVNAIRAGTARAG